MKNQSRTFHRFQKGFSIAEVLLAAFVLSIGLVAVLALVNVGLKETAASRDVIIASGLAQEGVELVRNVRDNNFATGLSDASFTANVRYPFQYFPSGSGNSNCRIDKQYNYHAPSNNISCIGASSSPLFNLNFSNGYYVHSSGTATKFSRKIVINVSGVGGSSGNPNARATVTSYVWWGSTVPTSTASCTIANECAFSESTLTNWK